MTTLFCKTARGFWLLVLLATVLLPASVASGQKQPTVAKPRGAVTKPVNELAKLRDDYVKTTKDYKASLQSLLTLYGKSVKKAEQQLDQSNKLFAAGLISKRELENSEQAVVEANAKVAGVHQQISGADTQIAQGLVEMQTEKQIAKVGRLPKGSLVQTTSFIRYNGGPWLLTQAGKIQNFFLQKFGRPLPIAVFGQGSIHNQWRLDHHNAMDVSVYPDTIEGQALMDFLRSNGIPFSAFRTAIPGVATGPHIHIGVPSHRY
jgi:hypothetical protein